MGYGRKQNHFHPLVPAEVWMAVEGCIHHDVAHFWHHYVIPFPPLSIAFPPHKQMSGTGQIALMYHPAPPLSWGSRRYHGVHGHIFEGVVPRHSIHLNDFLLLILMRVCGRGRKTLIWCSFLMCFKCISKDRCLLQPWVLVQVFVMKTAEQLACSLLCWSVLELGCVL